MELLRRWRCSLRSFSLDLVRLQHPLAILYLMSINSFFCFVAFYTSREVQLRSLYALIGYVICVDFVLAEHRRNNILLEFVRWMFNDFLNAFAVALCAFSVRELHEGSEQRAFFGSLSAVCAVVVAPAYAHRRVNAQICKFAARLFNRLRQLFTNWVIRPSAVLWDWLKYIVLLRWISVLVLRLNASLLSAWDWLDHRLFAPLRAFHRRLIDCCVYAIRLRWCADLWALCRRTLVDPTVARLGRLLDNFIYIFGCYWLKPLLNRMGRACLDCAKFGLRMFGRVSYASAALLYEHVLCPLLIFCVDLVEQVFVRVFHVAVRPLMAIGFRQYKALEDVALVYIVGPVLKRLLQWLPDRNPLEPESDHEFDDFMLDPVDGNDAEAVGGGDEAVQEEEEVADSAMESEGEFGNGHDLSSRLSSFVERFSDSEVYDFLPKLPMRRMSRCSGRRSGSAQSVFLSPDGDRLLASGLMRIDISGSDSEVDDFLPVLPKRTNKGSARRSGNARAAAGDGSGVPFT